MDNIFKLIIEKFEWKITERYMKLISLLAFRWAYGYTTSEILAKSVSYAKQKNPNEKVSKIIRDCLNILDTEIRFKLVKYFSAYIDILKLVLKEKELKEIENKIEPYHIFLEFGSCNPHALNLMALGLSRFSALYIEGKFDFENTVEAEEYIMAMRKMNFENVDMPTLCMIEIKDLIG